MLRTRLALPLLLSLLASACAAGSGRAVLRRSLDEATLPRSPAEVWLEVQQFLHERGFPLVGDDRLAVGNPAQGMLGRLFSPGFQTRVRADGSRVLETDLEARSRTRVRAEAIALPGGRSRIRLTVLKQAEWNPGEVSESKDEELEVALLQRLDPAVAARVLGKEPPAPPPAPAPAAAATAAGATTGPAGATGPATADAWAPLRDLLGTWTGTLPGGGAVTWRLDFVSGGRFLEVRGSPLLFAGPTARPAAPEELGRISRAVSGDRLVWYQFTNGGGVDRWESDPSRADALVFQAGSPESLPAGTRARLTLGRPQGDELLVVLDLAEPGKDFAVAGAVRLKRAR